MCIVWFKVSGSLNFDEEDTDACHAAEELLLREVGYCSHLALPAVLPRAAQWSAEVFGGCSEDKSGGLTFCDLFCISCGSFEPGTIRPHSPIPYRIHTHMFMRVCIYICIPRKYIPHIHPIPTAYNAVFSTSFSTVPCCWFPHPPPLDLCPTLLAGAARRVGGSAAAAPHRPRIDRPLRPRSVQLPTAAPVARADRTPRGRGALPSPIVILVHCDSGPLLPAIHVCLGGGGVLSRRLRDR